MSITSSVFCSSVFCISFPFPSMETASFLSRPAFPAAIAASGARSLALVSRPRRLLQLKEKRSKRGLLLGACALDKNPNAKSISGSKKKEVPISNYVVPLDTSASSCITRPLAEILRDLNKRVPDNTIKPQSSSIIPWYHANRMLSFYAPGWCGEIRDVIYSDNGGVTVVYRVTIRGSDGEVHRESTGTVSSDDGHIEDPVAAAEEIAFCRACARFGLGLYLYHEDENM